MTSWRQLELVVGSLPRPRAWLGPAVNCQHLRKKKSLSRSIEFIELSVIFNVKQFFSHWLNHLVLSGAACSWIAKWNKYYFHADSRSRNCMGTIWDKTKCIFLFFFFFRESIDNFTFSAVNRLMTRWWKHLISTELFSLCENITHVFYAKLQRFRAVISSYYATNVIACGSFF